MPRKGEEEMLVEIHMLQSHGPSNPNRDDLGAPKTAMFGGVLRARISSQCIKRSIRRHPAFMEALKGHVGDRTVRFPALVAEALKNSDIPEKEHPAIVEACTKIAKKEQKKEVDEEADEQEGAEVEEGEGSRTAQVIFLGPQEAREFARILGDLRREMAKDYKKFIEGDKNPAKRDKFWDRLSEAYKHDGVDIALFGRMTTSAAFQNVEASMQVAHAISTHGVVPETDYYTTVDDLQPKEQAGAGFVGEAQYASAVFYKYFSLDYDALLDNLAGGRLQREADENDEDFTKREKQWRKTRETMRPLAETTLNAFIGSVALAVPSGKRNSFANNDLPDAILVEVKGRKVPPTSYVNAFLKPTGPYSDSSGAHDVLDDSIRKLRHYAHSVRSVYGIDGKRLWLATRPDPLMDSEQMKGEEVERAATLKELSEKTLSALDGGSDA